MNRKAPDMNHFYQNIQGWFNFEGLYREIVRRAPCDSPTSFVEIGCWKGRSTAFLAVEIANSGKPISLTCVDPWELTDFYAKRDRSLDRSDPDVLFDLFNQNMQDVRDMIRMTVHRSTSLEAATRFPAQSLDFVFIDGDHSTEAVAEDIRAWLPLIKPTGILAGDDFNGGENLEVRRGLVAADVWTKFRLSPFNYPSWVISPDGSWDDWTKECVHERP